MSFRTEPWPDGVPCWADLTVPDVAVAEAFYAAVLGWTYAETSSEYGGYVIAQVGGHAAAGIGPLAGGAGLPAWTLYLATTDVDATAADVVELGGSLLVEPGDVGTTGRMLVAADPTGAVFGAWQAGDHIGAGVVNQPGGLTWEDLRSPDPDRARTFYSGVFGYDGEPVPMAGPDYSTFRLPTDEIPLGGMGGMMGIDGMPAHWLVYFGSASVDAAAAAARSAGGDVVVDPFDSPFGRLAGGADPFGAFFFVIESSAPDPRA